MIEIHLPIKKIFWGAQFFITALIGAGILMQAARCFWGNDFVFGLVPYLDADHEASLPTWFSTACLLILSLQVGFIAIQRAVLKDPFAAAWKGLSVIFLLCSIEEIASYHENFMVIMRKYCPQPIFYYPWVIPAMAILAVLGFFYFRWFMSLPKSFRMHFLLALGVYLGGAIGMEIVGGIYADHFGLENFTYAVITHLEEFTEMTGVNLLFYVFGIYLTQGEATRRIETILQVEN